MNSNSQFSEQKLKDLIPGKIWEISSELSKQGAYLVLVGGAVRDLLQTGHCKDLDFEIFHANEKTLIQILNKFGEVIKVGQSFGVFKVKGLDCDFSLPRQDLHIGKGHRGFQVEVHPRLNFIEASRRRDLTINSMGIRLETFELLDPHGGQKDLQAGLLRAVDENSFSEDPLRALRVMQFKARFEMKVSEKLLQLCRNQDLSELSRERIKDEFDKLFQFSRHPSLGLTFLQESGLLRFFPSIQSISNDSKQWQSLLMALDSKKTHDCKLQDRLLFRWSLLCNLQNSDELLKVWMDSFVFSNAEKQKLWFLRDIFMKIQDEKTCLNDFFLRRLSRGLSKLKIEYKLLFEMLQVWNVLSESAALANLDLRALRQKYLELGLAKGPQAYRVTGDFLASKGYQEGKKMGKLIKQCQIQQDRYGETNPELILKQVLQEFPNLR